MWRVVVGFVLGALCSYPGYVFIAGAGWRPETGLAPVAGAMPEATAALAERNRRLRERGAEIAALPQQVPTEPAPVRGMQVAEWLLRLRDKGVIQDTLPLRAWAGPLGDNICELLDLGPAERERLQGAMDDARAQLALLAAKHCTVSQDHDGFRVLTIVSFPEQGRQVFDDFSRAAKAILGEKRFAMLAGLANLEAEFDGFGTWTRLVTVQTQIPNYANVILVLHEDCESPVRKWIGRQGSYTSVQEMRESLGPIAEILLPTISDWRRTKDGEGVADAPGVD